MIYEWVLKLKIDRVLIDLILNIHLLLSLAISLHEGGHA